MTADPTVNETTLRYLAKQDIRQATRDQIFTVAQMTIPDLMTKGLTVAEAKVLRQEARRWVADGWAWEDAEDGNPFGYWRGDAIS